MTTSTTLPSPDLATEHVDVLIIGAGISGISSACHLRMQMPEKRFLVVEARDAIGGTWDLFRYPGIRSDSDMFTLGFDFRPWDGAKAIADGEDIRTYVEDTARAYGVTPHIRFGRRVRSMSWDGATARWTVEIERTDTSEIETLTASFVHGCTGYYRYDEGYLPEFAGMDDFTGTRIHPQHWPEDVEVAGKRIVVVGSGATAMTLVPALARQGAQVTMLQRSPTYVISLPGHDAIADVLRRHLPAGVAHSIIKWKNVITSWAFYRLSKRRPKLVKKALRKQLEHLLPPEFDIDTHFTPSYDPWDQRVCLVPDADLFKELKKGTATIVTDTIDRFVPEGIRLDSGEVLEADIVVTATGLNLLMMGGIELVVDGEPVSVPDTVAYKAMMLSGVPNFAFTVGYTNASWTLKADMVSDYVCRLLRHLDRTGTDYVLPVEPDPSLPREDFNNHTSGYIQRSKHLMPKAASQLPWRLDENYFLDRKLFRTSDLEDEGVRFVKASSRVGSRVPEAERVA